MISLQTFQGLEEKDQFYQGEQDVWSKQLWKTLSLVPKTYLMTWWTQEKTLQTINRTQRIIEQATLEREH